MNTQPTKRQLLTDAHVALPAGFLYFVRGDFATARKYLIMAIDARNNVVNHFHDGVRDAAHTKFQMGMCKEANRMITWIERRCTVPFRLENHVVTNEVLNNGVELPAAMLPEGFVREVKPIRPDYARAFAEMRAQAAPPPARPAITQVRPESPADLNARLRAKIAATADAKREEELRRRVREFAAARGESQARPMELTVQS